MTHQVQPGELCLYSSTFSGLIECHYIGRIEGKPSFRISKTKSGYKQGEVITDKAFVTPKKCFRKTGMFRYVSLPHTYT